MRPFNEAFSPHIGSADQSQIAMKAAKAQQTQSYQAASKAIKRLPISPLQKMLLGEITVLDMLGEHGRCYASNEYFADA